MRPLHVGASYPARSRPENRMRIAKATSTGLLAGLFAILLLAPGCATTADVADDPTVGLENADVVTRTEPNGDVVSEYRVAGQLQVVKVVPARGPTYYLIDRDGDRRPDDEGPVSPVYWKLFDWD